METTITDFWCDHCKKDLRLRGFKIFRADREFWANRCPHCSRELLRYCKDHVKDPYYRLSEKMQYEARKYAKDFLQPDHPDFDRIYPWVKKEREAKKEAAEKKEWEEQQKIIPGQRKKFTI